MTEKENIVGGLRIPELKEVIVGELAERGEWVVANVKIGSFWPVKAQKVSYWGETIWIMPVMKKNFPAVAMKITSEKSRAECEQLLMRFLSNLSWVEEKGFLVDGIGGSSLPIPTGRDKPSFFSVSEEFDLCYFPEPKDDKALLALALMREGRGLNHSAYAFLSFYRVLEVAIPDGRRRGEWITNQIGKINNCTANQVLEELRSQGIQDIGVHLRDSGRRAIAHAREEPIIDPDNPLDSRRLWSELPIMIELAQLAIEEVFGVKTSHTIWKEHLYELEGFKSLFGPHITDQLVKGSYIKNIAEIKIPNINVQIRSRESYLTLSNLTVQKVRQTSKELLIRFKSKDKGVGIRFRLNFAEERLMFDLFDDIWFTDTGTSKSAEAVAEVLRFRKEYFSNGQLHIYDAETNVLISRKDAYLPVNMMLNDKAADAEIAHWKSLAMERQELNEPQFNKYYLFKTYYQLNFDS